MRAVLIFLSFIAYTFIVGALLSPWAYNLIQWMTEGSDMKLFQYLHEQDFSKISNRCFMLIAATGIYPMLKAFDCFNKKELGYDLEKKEFIKEIGKGLPFGLLSLLLLSYLIIHYNLRSFDPKAGVGDFISAFLGAAAGALALSFIEETFFRGVVLNSMARTLKVAPAIFISSFLFASVHLLRNKTDIEITNIEWSTGFYYLSLTLHNFVDPRMLGSWLTLYACGTFLSFMSLHYGNIARCIGVHMGWVLMIKAFEKVTDTVTKDHWMIGSYDKVTGYLSFIIIGILCLGYWLFLSFKKKETAIEETA